MAQIKTRRQRVSFTADIAVSPSSQCQNSCKVQTIAFASQVRNWTNNNQRLVNLSNASFFNLARSVTHFTNLPTGKTIKLHKLRFPRSCTREKHKTRQVLRSEAQIVDKSFTPTVDSF